MLFWRLSVSLAQAQTVKIRERAAYVTPSDMKRVLNLRAPSTKEQIRLFEDKKANLYSFFFLYSTCLYFLYKSTLFAFLCHSENSNTSSGECDWCYPQTCERVLSLTDANRGGMRLRLLPIFLFDQFFCSLSCSVLTALSHKFSPITPRTWSMK